MQLPLFWIDAFTDRPFGGNPAAVVPLGHWPEDLLLQRMAFEHGLSETAFFVRTGETRFQLRWFTPRIEIDLCGHATLASAHALFAELGQRGERVTFDTRSGALTVARCADGKLELDFPARPAAPAVPPEALIRGLGCAPESTGCSEKMWLCSYATEEAVRTLQPDHAALTAVQPGRIIVTAPGRDCDFVSRFFAPDAGIIEDPVTGSAHCTLMPFWAARLGRTTLHARQVSERGGELWCELVGDRVLLRGHAVTYLHGNVVC
jgi:predicted PhzF superfamily epimerase YddE/YHI9